ncbi:MAG: hypothetical protein IBJ11_08660 [Phycisphaerales bacterium]|nr:hypothetical protein [Phycisphaerales bacterium]
MRRNTAASLALAAALVTPLVLVGCQSSGKGGTTAGPKVPAASQPAGFYNAECPVMEHPIDPNEFVMYKGKKIGFCCEDCSQAWKTKSDAERDELLAKVKKAK